MPKVTDEHKAARRRQILDAAARCFARDGFHRTSMQDIVRESGISAGLVYRYFTGKDDMITAIVTEWHDQRQAALAEGPAAETYLELLRAVGDPSARERMRLGVQIWAEAVRSPHIAEVARRTIDEPRAAVAELLQAAGEPNPDGLARALIALYQGLQLQTAWDSEVDNEAYVDAVQALLRNLSITSGGGQDSTR
jgi:TetR/AcrR family transcriptional regulator, transcriptional repressor of aconitase